MKLKSLVIILVLILIAMSVAPSIGATPAAAIDLPVIADDTAQVSNTASPFLNTETNLWVGGSKVLDTDPCGEQLETFLKFDLSTLPTLETITDATLTLKSNGFLANSSVLTMRLYGSSNTGWSEGVGQIASWASRPTPSADLGAEVTGIKAAGQNIVFGSTSQLVSYLEGQRKTDPAHLATLVIVATACNAPTSRQYLSSKETTGDNAFTPTLSLTTVPSTAVTLSTFNTSDPAVNWPLIVGLGVLALVVIVGLAVSRRRAAAR